MQITLNTAGRRFNKEWIFRGLSRTFNSGESIGIIGGNGSGKSTMLQVVSGFLIPSEGNITYNHETKQIDNETIYRYVSMASPFLELYEEYTASELFAFHSALKPMRDKIDAALFLETLQLENIRNKALKNYSSGMKQRVKLALAILSDTPLLLLDEPCSNLDKKAISWYQSLLLAHSENRIVLVSSNSDENELFNCTERLSVEDYKR